MSIHEKMNADYLWIRHAPVEEGLKVRYPFCWLSEITETTSCTTEHPIGLKGWKWSTGNFIINFSGLSENSMIGNLKSTDSAERVSIKPIRKEASKTCSDSSKIPMDTSIGKLLEISLPCPKLWSSASLLFGFAPSGKWRLTLLPLTESTNNSHFTERMWREARAEWRDSTRELQSSHPTFGTPSSEAHCKPTRSKSTQHGDKTSEKSFN